MTVRAGAAGTTVRATPFRLPLRQPLATARGVLAERAGLLFAWADGWGEATPVAGFGSADDFRRSAVECARRDCAARSRGVRLCDALGEEHGIRARDRVPTGRLVSGEGERLLEAARGAVAAGHRTIKVKIDGRDPRAAVERVAELRKALPDAVRVRIDANRSFDGSDATALCFALADLGVEMLEEPLRSGDPTELARLRRLGAVAIAADESAATREGARAVLRAQAADILVLKPSVLGLGATVALAREAARRGVASLVTSALDGAVARSAALHVAALLPADGPDAGLATDHLLGDDLAQGPAAANGALCLPDAPGLGLDPDPTAIERLRTGPDREMAA